MELTARGNAFWQRNQPSCRVYVVDVFTTLPKAPVGDAGDCVISNRWRHAVGRVNVYASHRSALCVLRAARSRATVDVARSLKGSVGAIRWVLVGATGRVGGIAATPLAFASLLFMDRDARHTAQVCNRLVVVKAAAAIRA